MLNEEDIQLLQTLSQTADMGTESTKQVMDQTDDLAFKKVLQEQLKGHNDVHTIVNKMMHYDNVKAKQASSFSKMQSQIMSSVKTLTSDNPVSKIAEMIIQGNTMGNTELTKKLHEYKGSNLELKVLTQQYMDTQQKNIEDMKKYL